MPGMTLCPEDTMPGRRSAGGDDAVSAAHRGRNVRASVRVGSCQTEPFLNDIVRGHEQGVLPRWVIRGKKSSTTAGSIMRQPPRALTQRSRTRPAYEHYPARSPFERVSLTLSAARSGLTAGKTGEIQSALLVNMAMIFRWQAVQPVPASVAHMTSLMVAHWRNSTASCNCEVVTRKQWQITLSVVVETVAIAGHSTGGSQTSRPAVSQTELGEFRVRETTHGGISSRTTNQQQETTP